MASGTIKRLVRDRGFGFIDMPGQRDLFFHASDLQGVTFDDLREGEQVEFEVTEDQRGKGPRAAGIRVSGGGQEVG